MLAIYGRPDTWNWLLLFHILSAMLLFSGAIVVAATSLSALRAATPERTLLLRRVALLTSLATILPYVGVQVFGIMLADREFGDEDPDWLGLGFGLTDLYGIISIILLSVFTWWAVRRARAGDTLSWQAKLASWLSPIGPVLLLVVLFLMTAKPD